MNYFYKKNALRLISMLCVFGLLAPSLVFATEPETTTPTEQPQPSQAENTTPTESQDTQESQESQDTQESTDIDTQEVDDSLVVVQTGDATGISDVNNQVNQSYTDISSSDTEQRNVPDSETESSENNEETNGTASDESVSAEDEDEAEGESANTTDENTTDQNSNSENTDTNTTASEGSTNTAEVEADNSISIDADSDADVDTDVTMNGTTGENTVIDNTSDAIVWTGNATLISNILNLINFNIIGTDAQTMAVNIIGSIVDDLDLSRFKSQRDIAKEVEQHEDFQKFVAENIGNTGDTNIAKVTVDNSVNIENDQNANVQNTVNLNAITGNNTVSKNGSVLVKTGNVFLASNITNVVNTTVIGDGFTLVIVNIVGSQFGGNIILPSLTADKIQDASPLQRQCDGACGTTAEALNTENTDAEVTISETTLDNSLAVDLDQQVTLGNDVAIKTNTGENKASQNEGDVVVATGDTVALSQVLNYVNTAIIGNQYVYGVVNVMHGAWNGDIWGVPQEGFVVENHGSYITFTHTPQGLTVFSNEFDNQKNTAVAKNTGNTGGTNESYVDVDNSTEIKTDQQATIQNNVSLDASSGNNTVSENDGDVIIDTGNVLALSNIFNMANTSVIGNNVVFAYINILGGEWNGDINFGMPDLHVVEIATPVDNQARPGGFIDYTIIVSNQGDAPATNVDVTAHTDPGMVFVEAADGAVVDDDGLITWTVPSLGIGEMKTFYYRARVRSDASNQSVVENHASAFGLEDDRNSDDNIVNTEVVVFGTPGPNIAGFGMPLIFSGANGNTTQKQKTQKSAESYANPYDSNVLQVTQTNDTKGLIRKGQQVTFTLTVENTKDESLYDVVVWDELLGPDGEVVTEQQWPLGEVLPYEMIEIAYTVRFSNEAEAGSYINSVWADGFDTADRYLIFPEKKDALVIRDELDPSTVAVDITYEYVTEKYQGDEVEEYLVITNESGVGINPGTVVVRFDQAYLGINNETLSSFSIPTPSLQPGEQYKIALSVLPRAITNRTQIQFQYILEGKIVSSLTSFQSVVPFEARRATIDQNNNQNTTPSEKTSSGLVDMVLENIYGHIALAESRTPIVLGYEKVLPTPVTPNQRAYFERRDMWLVIWVGVLALLYVVSRRQKKRAE